MLKAAAILLLSLGAASAVRVHPKNDHSYCLAPLHGPYLGADVVIEKCVDGAWYQQWEIGGAATHFKIKSLGGYEYCMRPDYRTSTTTTGDRVPGLKVLLGSCPELNGDNAWHPSSNSVNKDMWSFANTDLCLDNRENKLEQNNPVQIWNCAKEYETINQQWDITE